MFFFTRNVFCVLSFCPKWNPTLQTFSRICELLVCLEQEHYEIFILIYDTSFRIIAMTFHCDWTLDFATLQISTTTVPYTVQSLGGSDESATSHDTRQRTWSDQRYGQHKERTLYYHGTYRCLEGAHWIQELKVPCSDGVSENRIEPTNFRM